MLLKPKIHILPSKIEVKYGTKMVIYQVILIVYYDYS